MAWAKTPISLAEILQGGPHTRTLLSGHGVYAFIWRGQCVYVGYAAAEQFGARIVKHCIKVLGWRVGAVATPERWAKIASDCEYKLDEVTVHLWRDSLDEDGRQERLKRIEAFLIVMHVRNRDSRPRLNGGTPQRSDHLKVPLPAEMRRTEGEMLDTLS
jgi:hypothetical protein